MKVGELRAALANMPDNISVYNVAGQGIKSAQHTIKGNLVDFSQFCELATYFEEHNPNYVDLLIERETGFVDRRALIAAYKALKTKFDNAGE